MLKAFLFDIAPWIAYAFFAIAPLFQTWRLYKRKQSGDISLSYFFLAIAAQTLLVPRLIAVTNDSLVLTGHLFSLATNVLAFAATLYYRRLQKEKGQ
jgi:hypothetical protein